MPIRSETGRRGMRLGQTRVERVVREDPRDTFTEDRKSVIYRNLNSAQREDELEVGGALSGERSSK